MSTSFTVRELRNVLNEAVQDGREDDPVRVVYHGWTKPSFNLPVHNACIGPNNDFLVITEEPRDVDAR